MRKPPIGQADTCPKCSKQLPRSIMHEHLRFCTGAGHRLRDDEAEYDCATLTRDEEKEMVSQLLGKKNWLSNSDFEFIESLAHQIDYGELSKKQREILIRIYKRFRQAQAPRFFPGGAPSTGRRR